MIDGKSSIIWDWNGTLLDDTHFAVSVMNRVLQKRGMNLLSVENYKSVFTFPVKNYYQKIGFDFSSEPFEIPANEFIDLYNADVEKCSLHRDVVRVLTHFQKGGRRQFILSAMEQTVLNQCLQNYQIDCFFEYASGLDNIYAASKIGNGHRLIAEQKLNPGKLVLIGDTVHDFEVATALGCQCILIADGHQSEIVLQATGARVLRSIAELLD